MRGNGITYDTGFFNAGVSTHEPFDPQVVKREMRVIHEDLHCNVVRITGGNADRLEMAAIHAADASLEVWFSPFTCDLTTDELLDFLADCAERAERLRQQGAEIVFVTGAELSLFTVGFLPGDTLKDRLDLLAVPHRLRERLPQLPTRINAFLGKAAARVRERFVGKISYASIPFEGVDWTPFDFISVDAYRSIAIANRYRDDIRALVAQGKPVAITFASYHLPHRRDPRVDLDMVSYGVVKVLEDRLGHSYPDMAWELKAAFTTLADYYHG